MYFTNMSKQPKVNPINIGPDISDSNKNLSSHLVIFNTHNTLSLINSKLIPKSKIKYR